MYPNLLLKHQQCPYRNTFFGLRQGFTKKCKDDQNGLIHPENGRLTFIIIGGSGQMFGLIVRFYFNLIILFLWSYLLDIYQIEVTTSFLRD